MVISGARDGKIPELSTNVKINARISMQRDETGRSQLSAVPQEDFYVFIVYKET